MPTKLQFRPDEMTHKTTPPTCQAASTAKALGTLAQRSSGLGRTIVSGALALVLVVPHPAYAANISAAEVLFDAGRDAMRRHAYDEACLKFKESNQLDEAPGTVMNLANCEQKRGNIATAWEYFTQAMELLDPTDRRYAVAKDRALRLEASVPRLVVTLAPDAPSTSVVRRDGKIVGTQLGLPARVDPGEHTVSVEAPNHEPGHYRIRLELGDMQRLEVMPGARLTPAAPSSLPAQGNSQPVAAPNASPSFERPDEVSEAPGTWRWVLAGTSIGTLVAGGVFGALSYREWSTVKAHCDLDLEPYACDQTGLSAQSRGKDLGVTALVLGGIGIVAGGAFIVVAAGSDSDVSVSAGAAREYNGLSLTGTF